MKAIRFCGEIGSISAKRDGSLGLRIGTPELSAIEKADIMELQGINVDVFVKPLDADPSGIVQIDKEINPKTQSQRLRAVLFLLWTQEGSPDIFNIYYHRLMEKVIDHFKNKLEEYNE